MSGISSVPAGIDRRALLKMFLRWHRGIDGARFSSLRGIASSESSMEIVSMAISSMDSSVGSGSSVAIRD